MENQLTLRQKLNFFICSFIGILGISLVPEILTEDDKLDKVDDILMLVLSFVVIAWARRNNNINSSSSMPVWFLVIAILIKIGAIAIEHADKEAVGDDFGVLAALIIAFIFVGWMLYKNKQTSRL